MKILRKIPDVFGFVSAVLMAAIWALMMAEVLARNVFDSPILGASEIAIYLYVTAAYWGFSYTQKEKGHICVELLYDRLGAQAKRVVDAVAYVLGDILFAFFTFFTWKMFANSWAVKEIQLTAMKMPVYILKLAVAIGVTVMLVQLIIDTVDAIKAAAGLAPVEEGNE